MTDTINLPGLPFGLPPGEPIEGKTYIADGWVYRDMPGRVSFEYWDKFLDLLGEGNYVILIRSEGRDWKRGQFLISPDGMENLAVYSARQKASPTNDGEGIVQP